MCALSLAQGGDIELIFALRAAARLINADTAQK